MPEPERLDLLKFFATDNLSHLNGPITIPRVDFPKVFNEIRKRYPTHAIQDLMRSFLKVVFLSTLPHFEKNIIKSILANCNNSDGIYYDSHYSYFFSGDSTFQHFRCRWWNRVSINKRGDSLFSLVRTIKGCSDFEAFFYVSKILHVDLSEHDVVQYQSLNDENFVRESHAYPVTEKNNAGTLYGSLDKEYTFENDHGRLSFKLQVWNRDNELYQLFYSLQHCDRTGDKEWKFISPPIKYLIFNRHLIYKLKNNDVHIHDDIDRSDSSCSGVSIINTWSGDFSISSLLDWDFLKGRDVTYLFDEYNLKSTMICFQLIDKFSKLKTQLKLRPVSNGLHQKNYMIDAGHGNTSPDFKNVGDLQVNNLYSLVNAKGDIAIDDFYKFAKNYHNIDLKQEEIEVESYPTTISDLERIQTDTSFMVDPLFREGAYVLITAKQKVGKSFFAIDISYMIAAGGSIKDWLSAKNPYKVLYIDSEMPTDGFKERIVSLQYNYNEKNLINENFSFRLLRDRGIKLDLTTPKDQEFVEGWIKGHKFIVFDNLDGLTNDAALYSKSWGLASSWFKSLTSRGITVFLVHHENEAGGKRGTGKITDDVDLSIVLKKPADCPKGKSIIEFHIMDARYLYGKSCDSFVIEYCTENNETKRTIRPFNADSKDYEKNVVPSGIKPQSGLEDLKSALLNPTRHAEKWYIQAGMFIIKGMPGRSKGTVGKRLKEFCESGLLIRKGIKQDAKYVLKVNLAEYCKMYEPPNPFG